MITLRQTKEEIHRDPKWWCIHLMDFVDDFRYYKDLKAVTEPFLPSDERMDALLASTAESLCDEIGVTPPDWLRDITFKISKQSRLWRVPCVFVYAKSLSWRIF